METSLDPHDLLQILRRRKWWLLIPLTVAAALAVSLIFLLPAQYRSQATLLIDQQEVSDNFVPSLVTEQIDRRLEAITQRVLLTDTLYRIAERYDLYPEERHLLSRGAIAGKMRQSIQTGTLVTDFNDPVTGRSGQSTLAFQISFDYYDPAGARKVVDELVSRYLSTNLEGRRAVADQTTSFLAAERASLDEKIARIEDELTRFKTENRELLPGEAAFKRQVLNNLEQRLRNLDGDLRVARERESYLSTQLALIDEFDGGGGGRGETPESRLELLRAELATARARYRPGHPDVVRLQREVASLESVVGARSGSTTLAEREAALAAELATLRERYTDEHPDIKAAQRELAALRQQLEAGGQNAAPGGVSRNATFIQLSAQLNSVRAEIKAIEEEQAQIRDERLELQEQLAKAPEIEREFNRIMRRLDNAVADRQEIADREATARLSGSLETTAAGERLTLIEPPSNGWQIGPNKMLILAIGLVLGMGSGGALLTLAEFLDRSIRSAKDVARILGDTPLAALPIIRTAADQRRKWLRRAGGTAVILVLVGGTTAWVHQRIAPLDVLGYQAMNQAEQWMVRTFPVRSNDESGTSSSP